MSDNIKDLAKDYEHNVFIGRHPRRYGLFPIPEYPELEAKRGMWSAALDAILTTLRYLAPATLLTLFWGQQSFLFKLLRHIDSAFRAIVFSSEEQKQSVLQWLAETGPVRVEHLDTVWRHGWIVCGVLDVALPGACAGHPPTRLSIKHAQAIADHYLGVEPVFSRQELESNDSLSKHQEWKLATYLDRIRQSLAKLTPPVSKPCSQRTSPETAQFTLDYVAKGSGLSAAQIHSKMYFKIYPTSQQSLDPGEVTILIRGPKDTYGMTVIPPILGKAQLIRQKLLGLQSKSNYTENALPITQGATYLRYYGRNDMNKTYFIPKTKYDIDIEVDPREDHVKISYKVHLEGKYEISITSRGQGIVGSPFSVTAAKNILSILEHESFSLEDGEEIDIVDIKTDRKAVLRIVDFVTEKMLLRENGALEKITEDEAKVLLKTDSTEEANYERENIISEKNLNKEKILRNLRFYEIANKVILMGRVCTVFNDLIKEKSSLKFVRPRSQQDIPDIVNSTLTDCNINPFILPEARDKYIIPENISVSLCTEKIPQRELLTEHIPDPYTLNDTYKTDVYSDQHQHDNDIITYNEQEDDILMVITSSPSNPFLQDKYDENFVPDKTLRTYVTTEYETNNSQNEEIPDSPIKILVEENLTPSPVHNNNPFVDTDLIEMERPKTPVYKIISGDVKDRDEVYVDPKIAQLNEEMLGNEFINPFFIHQQLQSSQREESLPITDFIIGAPVSLPPMIRTSTPDPTMESLIITDDDNIMDKNLAENQDRKNIVKSEDTKSVFSTPLHTNLNAITDQKIYNNSATSSTFHSLDSNITENIEILSLTSETQDLEPYQLEDLQGNRNVTPKKDIWDSAYVSIDENNSSPDSNNNDNTQSCDTFSKQKFSPSDTLGIKDQDLSNMGPAERELWETCNELSDTFKATDEFKINKWELKRPMFTPIIEESDRSISSGMKDISRDETSQSKLEESDQVAVAFAELNDMYRDYFPNSETDSTATLSDDNNKISEVEFILETNDCVDSASEKITDVKRQTNKLEGKISEVQANVTESLSVSQILHDLDNEKTVEDGTENIGSVQFGDQSHTNIVMERKKYWDDRIRQIEAKSQESTTLQKKRRLSLKYLRNNDSLTKRRGKQIIKNFLSAGDIKQTTPTKNLDNKFEEITRRGSATLNDLTNELKSDVKLVDKWKQFWDEKMVSENNDAEVTCFTIKSPKNKIQASSQQNIQQGNSEIQIYDDKTYNHKQRSSSLPVKQELPEEVFKAFETSPKRFFGTSRKQILSKIDTFLGKPSTEDDSPKDIAGASQDSGLVSSRISLFHSISHTEESSYERRKCKSLHNIYQRKDSVKSTDYLEIDIKNTTEEHSLTNIEKINVACGDTKSELDDHTNTTTTLREKRGRIAFNTFNKSFDESVYQKSQCKSEESTTATNYVQRTVKDLNKQGQHLQKYKKSNELRRKSFSKSEMDIFNKAAIKDNDDGLDKYKSCDELPKINVKNFISLYETVSKTPVGSNPVGKLNKSTGLMKGPQSYNSNSGEAKKRVPISQFTASETHEEIPTTPSPSLLRRYWTNKSCESISSSGTDSKTNTDSLDIEINQNKDKETTFLSLSDIELEIVENNPKLPSEPSSENNSQPAHIDYKSRFKMAKQYFQSLEELTDTKKPRKLNECELLLQKKSTDSVESTQTLISTLSTESDQTIESTDTPEENRPQKRVKKNIKSHSMPSSEISKIWNQLQEKQESDSGASKLIKISEKFNVDDLFTDVTEGKLSRQGSLRGIPHKKAVLEAFRSMENLADKKMSPYEIAVSQLSDFAEENRIKNAQTYLSEYPYLPTTAPSKYQSRLDAKASGLISLKELKEKKPRRNSVPDLRLNPTFTVNL